MTIPLTLLNRFAVPFLVAALYLGNNNFPAEVKQMETTMRLSDEVLSKAKGEGQQISEEVFDYIIVGAGSAGAILANRLTASGADKVLVLEAGGDPSPVLETAYGSRYSRQAGLMSWGFASVKQNTSCLANGGICRVPRGKILGGSSQINDFIYNRALPKDYDLWAEFTGDESWRWENIRETFNRIESYHGFYENDTSEFGHGSNGELYVGKTARTPIVELITEALNERGIPIGDLNTGDLTNGFSKVDLTMKEGTRSGTYQCFLEPILERPNLIIYRYAYATKINFEGTKAVGVTYERHGLVQNAVATKEVILAAGAIGSPQLLLLSGIGPKEDLEEVGIPTLVDLPVGKYLQDHPGSDISDAKNGGFLLNTTFAADHNTTEALLQFLTDGSGPMNGFAEAGGISSYQMRGHLSSSFNSDPSFPDVLILIVDNYRKEPEEKEVINFSVELLRINNTGTVKLASNDPQDKPLIDFNFFSDPTDLERMVDAINVMMDFFVNSTAFQKVGLQMIEPLEACSDETFLSREYWKCYVMQTSRTCFHPTSSCRMAANPMNGVVDSSLRVFNTTNLRVVDASVMPTVPSGNTNMPSMLIGQRGAEIILSGK